MTPNYQRDFSPPIWPEGWAWATCLNCRCEHLAWPRYNDFSSWFEVEGRGQPEETLAGIKKLLVCRLEADQKAKDELCEILHIGPQRMADLMIWGSYPPPEVE